jgi:membrane associated rhomboid family serine protease
MSASVTPPTGPSQEPAAPPAPHCYRHTDRETYVSCVRCGRPICPECMRPAPVGFQCPEEMRESGRGGRPAGGTEAAGTGAGPRPDRAGDRTPLGGRLAPGRPGLVTQVLVGLCLFAYVLQGLPGLALQSTVTLNRFTTRFDLDGFAIADQHQYYRLLTAAFLHENLLHIAFNMYALYLLGFQLELLLGRVRLLALFVVCAVGGSTLSFLVHGRSTSSLGASTAIFGFFATYYLVARRLRVDTSQILVIVAINLGITFLWPGIDKYGHIGGLLTGLAVGAVFAYIPPRKALLQGVLVAGVLAVLVAAVALRVSSLSVT